MWCEVSRRAVQECCLLKLEINLSSIKALYFVGVLVLKPCLLQEQFLHKLKSTAAIRDALAQPAEDEILLSMCRAKASPLLLAQLQGPASVHNALERPNFRR